MTEMEELLKENKLDAITYLKLFSFKSFSDAWDHCDDPIALIQIIKFTKCNNYDTLLLMFCGNVLFETAQIKIGNADIRREYYEVSKFLFSLARGETVDFELDKVMERLNGNGLHFVYINIICIKSLSEIIESIIGESTPADIARTVCVMSGRVATDGRIFCLNELKRIIRKAFHGGKNAIVSNGYQ